MSSVGRRMLWAGLIAVPLCLAAVVAIRSGMDGTSRDPVRLEEDLRARCAQFWSLRLKGDWAKTYDLMEPRTKEEVSLSEFLQSRGIIQYLGYSIEKVEIDGNRGTVTVKVECKIEHPMVKSLKNPYMESLIKDEWVRIAGTWYRKYVPPSFGQKS